jgi:hypothetical protein
MKRLFLDTTVLLHAAGGTHPLREPSRSLVEQARSGALELHVSTEAIQEFLFHRLRRTHAVVAVLDARDASAFCRVHAFDTSVLERSIDLVESTNLRGRDAVHAATAQVQGFSEIVSADRDFDGIPGLTRVDPAEAAV